MISTILKANLRGRNGHPVLQMRKLISTVVKGLAPNHIVKCWSWDSNPGSCVTITTYCF